MRFCQNLDHLLVLESFKATFSAIAFPVHKVYFLGAGETVASALERPTSTGICTALSTPAPAKAAFNPQPMYMRPVFIL